MALRVSSCLLMVFSTIAFGLLADRADGQAYSYKDERGRWHFTDNPAAVPPEYRDEVQERPMNAPPSGSAGEDDGFAGRFLSSSVVTPVEGELGSAVKKALGAFLQRVNQDRRARSLPPLAPRQRQRVEGWLRSSLKPWIASLVLSVIVTIGLMIHGFANGHPIWAIANFLLTVTQPFYVLLHIARESIALRMLVLLVALIPWGISFYIFWGLFEVIREIAV